MNEKPAILICDDEVGVRESLNLILSDHYMLDFAQNAVEGIELLRRKNYALLFLDIKMPKLNGLEALKQIRQLKPAMPVILVTGYQSAEIAQEALSLGAFDYIPKPFDSAQILQAASLAAASQKK